jgi:L-fucose isomerase-like protein
MSDFQVIYITIGVPTFHQESAKDQFQKSVTLLNTLTTHCTYPEGPLLSIKDLKDFLSKHTPDLVILQNTTFANSAYATEVIKATNCPLLLWTLREPVIDGTRLRLNSLTGAYSAGNVMHHLGRDYFEYVFGAPSEDKVIAMLDATIKAAHVKKSLRSLTIASIGHTPQGFGFGRGLDAEVAKNFGASLESIEARELMTRAKSYAPEDYADLREEALAKTVGLMNLPEENIDGFLRLYKAYKSYIDENAIGAIASRCWPDFFVEYKTPVCGVLGMLNDIQVAASCESDLYGALSMYVGINLSNSPVFFGDPVSLNEDDSTITFWHCGTAACSLARPDEGATMGVHPNRQIGPTMEFGCKAADEVTIFRIGRKPDGTFRLFIASGAALDLPKQFFGTSVVVQTKNPSGDIVHRSVSDGWEPHFVVIYKDVAQELEIFGRMLGFEIHNY